MRIQNALTKRDQDLRDDRIKNKKPTQVVDLTRGLTDAGLAGFPEPCRVSQADVDLIRREQERTKRRMPFLALVRFAPKNGQPWMLGHGAAGAKIMSTTISTDAFEEIRAEMEGSEISGTTTTQAAESLLLKKLKSADQSKYTASAVIALVERMLRAYAVCGAISAPAPVTAAFAVQVYTSTLLTLTVTYGPPLCRAYDELTRRHMDAEDLCPTQIYDCLTSLNEERLQRAIRVTETSERVTARQREADEALKRRKETDEAQKRRREIERRRDQDRRDRDRKGKGRGRTRSRGDRRRGASRKSSEPRGSPRRHRPTKDQ